jgi:hypothetical protein
MVLVARHLPVVQAIYRSTVFDALLLLLGQVYARYCQVGSRARLVLGSLYSIKDAMTGVARGVGCFLKP